MPSNGKHTLAVKRFLGMGTRVHLGPATGPTKELVDKIHAGQQLTERDLSLEALLPEGFVGLSYNRPLVEVLKVKDAKLLELIAQFLAQHYARKGREIEFEIEGCYRQIELSALLKANTPKHEGSTPRPKSKAPLAQRLDAFLIQVHRLRIEQARAKVGQPKNH